MNKLYSSLLPRWTHRPLAALGLLLALTEAARAQTTTTYAYTGSPQTYTVPAGVTAVQVVATGASGGSMGSVISTASSGARVQATVAVTPGEVLTIMVGGQGEDGTFTLSIGAGGYNGGGAGNIIGSGGGASDVRRASGTGSTGDYLTSRNALLVAGGGGGSDYLLGTGGNGGTPSGSDGTPSKSTGAGSQGRGATQSGPGSGGNSTTSALYAGSPGSNGTGGAGNTTSIGSGGGGGYYGGGGSGGQAGGGGGSSWVMPTGSTGISYSVANTTGNGLLSITPLVVPTIASLSPSSGPVGTSVTLTGTNLGGTTAVSFNGTPATFTVVSATAITATVPSGTSSGNVTVTTPGGISNEVAFTVGLPPNNALAFDAVDDYVAVNAQAGVSNLSASGYTIETWVYFNALAPNVNSIVRKDGDYNFFVRGGTVEAQIWQGSTLTYTNSTTVLTAGRWNHVAGTWDGTRLRVYVNGVDATGTTSSFNITASSPLWLGRSATFNEPLNGRLDETRLYNMALTPAQIQADMYSTTSAQPANLQLYYNFDQGVAGGNNLGLSALNDQSGNGNNGTLTNFDLTGTTSNWVRSFPTITGISPSNGLVGSSVSLMGTNLLDATSFRFNGTAVAPFTMPTNDLVATVTVPNGATTGPVIVASAALTNYSGPTFTVTPGLSVQYQTGDFGQPTDGQVRPFLQLVNSGTTAVPYSSLTVRYWLTVENFMGQLITPIDYAKLGTSFVSARYVALATSRQGAYGYIEYSFAAGAGNLAAGTNSGPIYGKAYKPDYTNFDETDDWSYQTSSSFTPNDHVTLYQNGMLLAGTEPPAVASTMGLSVFSASRDASASTQFVSVQLQVRNTGNTPVNYADVKLRYYFTRDGATSLVPQLDYAKLGNGNITLRMVNLSGPLTGADAYLEIGFSAALGVFYPRTSTDDILLKLRKDDYSALDQTNDYSFTGATALAVNNRFPAYLNGNLVFGTPPAGAPARLAASSAPASASGATVVAAVSGPQALTASPNPFGEQLTLRFALPTTQAYTLAVYDGQGRLVQQLASGEAAAEQAQEVAVPTQGYAAGLYLVRLTTASGVQTLKLVKQ